MNPRRIRWPGTRKNQNVESLPFPRLCSFVLCRSLFSSLTSVIAIVSLINYLSAFVTGLLSTEAGLQGRNCNKSLLFRSKSATYKPNSTMLSTLDIVLLVLCAQVVSAGPLRRFQDTSSSHAVLPSSVYISSTSQSTQKHDESTSADIFEAHSAFAGPSASFLSSLLRFHQTATAFSTRVPPSEPTGNTQAASSQPPRNTQAIPSESASNTQAVPSSPDRPRFRPRPDPNNSQSPNFGGHGNQSEDGVTTTTLTVTTTVLPNRHGNTSVTTTGAFRHPAFQNGATRPGGVHETGARVPSNSTRPTNFQTGSSERTQSSQPIQSGQPAQNSRAAPSTTFFVLGSSTLVVTVSTGRGGIPTSHAVPSSNSATTTTITRMRTRFSTTTIIPASSSSFAQQDSRTPGANGESRAVATGKSTTQTFPNFSFAPTSAQTPSPSSRLDRTTVLPSIVTPSASASSSALPTGASSAIESQQPPSASSSSVQSTTTTTGIAGITIVPVNPDATTIYVTVTTTDAGVTTTIARETVTADQCHGWRCWRDHGRGSQSQGP